MKLRSMVVVTLLVLACSAAFAQTYTFGFGPGICDYETFTVTGSFAAGTHNYTTACAGLANAVLIGFAVTLPVSGGSLVTGPVVVFADNSFDLEAAAYTGCQLVLVSRKKASAKTYGWVYYYTCSPGSDYAGNYGYLTKMLDASGQAAAGRTSVGKVISEIKAQR